MATAMQEKQTESQPSVAKKKLSDLLRFGKNAKEEDGRLLILLEICCKEQEELEEAVYKRDQERWAKEWCFGTFAALRANWCAEQALLVPAGKYPKSRKFLATHIVDGMLGARMEKDRKLLAELLCVWPKEDGKIPADAFREMTEFRWSGESYKKEILPTLTLFFGCLAKPITPLNEEVVRMAIKLLGTWAPVSELQVLGPAFAALQGRARQPLLDLVRHTVE